MASQCPVCGASSFKSLASLERHVEQCLAAASGDARHTSPSVTQESQSIQCTMCGAWVSLLELDAHESMHAQQQRPPASHQSDAELAAAEDAAATAEAIAAIQAADADAAAAAIAREEEARAGEAARAAAEMGQGAEAAARALQEQQDFEALRERYGFAPEQKPGQTCHNCRNEGHWAKSCPHKAANFARLSTEPTILVQQQRPEPQFHGEQQQQQQQQQEQQPSSSEPSTSHPSTTSPCSPEITALLQPCLVQHSSRAGGAYCGLLSGPVHHFCSGQSDAGWGCGWRNIQMQVSHLIARQAAGACTSHPQQHAAPHLFGPQPIVPDIGSLQAWLESAWQAGFDPQGAESLGGSIQGDRKWIGTTEACSILRHQGVDAQIIDFVGSGSSRTTMRDGSTVHAGVACDACGACPVVGTRHRSLSRSNYDLCGRCAATPVAERVGPFEVTGVTGPSSATQSHGRGDTEGATSKSSGTDNIPDKFHLPLLRWTWDYFSGQHTPSRHMHHQLNGSSGSSSVSQHTPNALAHTPLAAMLGGRAPPPPVLRTGLPPLYFQHEGHSRTIIGIERTRKPPSQCPTQPQQHSSHKRATLEPDSGPQNENEAATPQQEDALSSQLVLPGGPAAPFDVARYTYTLLVLDPGISTRALEDTLRSKSGWQRFIRRGLHTLRHDQYQLLYCRHDAHRQQAKIVRASEVVRS